MNVNTVFPSKYLKADELQEDTTYTIASVSLEELGQGNDKETKPVAYFNETEKGVALNKTNCATISGLYGPETDDWIGKPITLFAQEVDFQGKQVLAIRVRMRAPARATSGSSIKADAVAKAPASLPASPGAACWAAYSQMVKAHGDAEPQDAYTAAEAKEVFAKVLGGMFPGKTTKTLTADEWAHAQETIAKDFLPASRDLSPF